ncbi:DUF1553 domain-containing protein [Planctomicrobium sp. SH668]|uniref:DUF1553 domain-containing protein n=1 Tax=Planctomicrobium sp. SH668 TaxID=3448126 RepID=UPI003F5B81A1
MTHSSSVFSIHVAASRFLSHSLLRSMGVVAAVSVLSQFSLASDDKPLSYNKDIRPILAENCFSCHGADSASRKADLRLDQRDAAIAMSAIDPGHPDLSELIARVMTTDHESVMPPAETKKTLTEEQKQTLKRWIEQGAEYELHWSFITPVKMTPPQVQHQDLVKNPIDQFVFKHIEEAGLAPSPEADRRTLIRRLSLDLTGLPPTPEVVEEFVNDQSPDAYEKFVDRFLSSPAWGEHRGRYWLDYARYADSHGIHFDNYREMWTYRDWVVGAFNQNMPYSQFTIENLAGDLLPNATLDQQIASGFNRCNMTTNEGGAINEEYLVLYTRDRTDTTAQVWMGLTAGCAVCHTHKFDPISHQEFYELAAFFNNTTQSAMDGNIKDTPPVIFVPLEGDRTAWIESNESKVQSAAAVASRRDAARPLFEEWLATADPAEFSQTIPTDQLAFYGKFDNQASHATVSILGESTEIELDPNAQWTTGFAGSQAAVVNTTALATLDNVGDFGAGDAFSVSAWVKTPANDGGGAIVARMDTGNNFRGWDFWMEGRRVGCHIINEWSSNALKVVSEKQIPANEWVHVAYTYDGSKQASGVKIFVNGELQKNSVQADALSGDIRTTVPFKIGQRNADSLVSGLAVNDIRIYSRSLTQAESESLGGLSTLAAILEKDAGQRTEDEKKRVFDWWLDNRDQPYQTAVAFDREVDAQINAIKARGSVAHVMNEKPEMPVAYILDRGEYDRRTTEVKPNTPAVLPAFPEDLPRNRLGFAKWLLLPEQPLTSRVTVNRFWQEVFGTGIVRSSGDFGIMGELPSNQALLDWMAIDFIESGWDVKRLFKQIVMSHTYRQSAVITSELRERDPDNRLLARGPRFRMDAEMVRDYALAASGVMVHKIGGPSLKPYQPDGIWEVVGMDGSTTRNYRRDSGESLYRRSLYSFVKRMAPPASLEIFNAPNREFCVVRRERTNTPLQALVTLNDEQYVEAARVLAQTALQSNETDRDARIQFISKRLLSRELQARELEIVSSSLEQLQKHFDDHLEDAKLLIAVGESKADEKLAPEELAAWTMLTNELMNLDEVLNK